MDERDANVHTRIEKLKLSFVKSDYCVLKYWKERKSADEELYLLSNIIYGVPPTQVNKIIKTTPNLLLNCLKLTFSNISQVSIERAFSSLRIILTESRNRLNKETLENILLVKLNPDKSIEEA